MVGGGVKKSSQWQLCALLFDSVRGYHRPSKYIQRRRNRHSLQVRGAIAFLDRIVDLKDPPAHVLGRGALYTDLRGVAARSKPTESLRPTTTYRHAVAPATRSRVEARRSSPKRSQTVGVRNPARGAGQAHRRRPEEGGRKRKDGGWRRCLRHWTLRPALRTPRFTPARMHALRAGMGERAWAAGLKTGVRRASPRCRAVARRRECSTSYSYI